MTPQDRISSELAARASARAPRRVNSLRRSHERAKARRAAALLPFALVVVGAAALGAFAGRRPGAGGGANARVAGVQLNTQDTEAARAALEKWAKSRRSLLVTLRLPPGFGGGTAWKGEAGRLGLGLDTEAMLDEALRAQDAGLLQRLSNWVGGARPSEVAPRPTVDRKLLAAALRRVGAKVDRPARNARLIPGADGSFSFKGDTPGVALDRDASLEAVTLAWQESNRPAEAAPAPEAPPTDPPDSETGTPEPETPPITTPAPTPPIEAELTLTTTQARVTKAMLQEVDGVIGSFSTRYGGTGLSRGSNIALAAGRIHGTLLAPGEVFSYNRVVGPRVASAGFRDAPVIVRGELVPGIGGGICQVSSTLYNAALRAGLKIVRRQHHAFPVSYVPVGLDATVVDGAIDFRFQNDTGAPVYIAAGSRRGRLSFRLFGKTTPGRSVNVYTTDHTVEAAGSVTKTDPSLPAGRRVVKQAGKRGHRVRVWRTIKDGETVVKRELIASDRYRPFPSVVLVGTRRVARPAPKPPSPTEAAPEDAAPTPPAETTDG